MYVKLAISTTILGAIVMSVAGYANANSRHLSGIQARNCPALTGQSTATAIDLSAQIAILSSDNSNSNRLLALTAICNGYGYGGVDFVEADSITPGRSLAPGRSVAAVPQSLNGAGSDPFLYFNNRPLPRTPQSTTQFDQLPQDRVEAVAPL